MGHASCTASCDFDCRFRSPGYADEAYARVRKWTARVDLFSKDFIVFPVNQSLHWSLVIICHLGEAERLLDERRVTDVDADVIDVRFVRAIREPSLRCHARPTGGWRAC